jgi:hypothetical protein
MLEDLTPPVRVLPCKIREIIKTLNETDQVILKDAIANVTVWSNKGLSKALIDKGLPLGETIIRQRRTKACDDCICR